MAGLGQDRPLKDTETVRCSCLYIFCVWFSGIYVGLTETCMMKTV
jgi:hypothetical protein